MFQIVIMSQAQKDAKKLASSGLKPKALKLLELIRIYRMWTHYE